MSNTLFIKEYSACIIDTFEDFLSEKGIDIENDEKEGDDGEAIIYGSDFDFLMEKLNTPLLELAKESKESENIDTENWSN